MVMCRRSLVHGNPGTLFLRFILSFSVALVHACGLPILTCDPFCARLLGTCVRRATR